MRLGLSRSFWVLSALIVFVTAAGIALPRAHDVAEIGTGYMAQKLCSGVFVSGREPENVLHDNLAGPGLLRVFRFFSFAVDFDAKEATASAFGYVPETAIYRDGFGCTLLHGENADALRAQTDNVLAELPALDGNVEWPEGSKVSAAPPASGVDEKAMHEAIERIFAEPNPERLRRTWALVVVHKGRIVAERYAPGFHERMPLIGWSLSKTATNALVGLRVMDGALSLADKALVPEWRDEDDPRGAITLDELMRMTSGLAFDQKTDAPRMLFIEEDDAHYAASKPLAYSPGTHWSYSSGNTNIIAGILRETFADERDYLRFPHERLFEPLGMRTASIATDDVGTFVSSTFLYASARDWARLALLFLQDGVWNGKRLLPAGWVSGSLKSTPQSPAGQYGAQVWLKLPDEMGPHDPRMPDNAYYMLGHNAYYMIGFNGQVVVTVPSRDLIVVRLGLTREDRGSITWDLAPLVNAFPEHKPD